MTDLFPDPTEDRLRRTFAVRADDMAPGDGAAGDRGLHELLARPVTEGSRSRHDRGPGRFLLAAAIVVIVGAALAAVGVVMANDGGDGSGDDTGDVASDGGGSVDTPVAELLTAQRMLVTALQDERNLAAIELIGADDILAQPVDDAGEARRRTDSAIAALRTLTDTDPAASAYQQVLDELGGLAALRGDVDADDGPRDMSNVDASSDVFDRYAQLVSGLLDAQEALVPTIDDPEQQAGFELYRLGLRQQELTARLVRATLLNAIVPADATSLAEANRLYLVVLQGQEELITAAHGTAYEEATATAVGEIEASGLLDIVDTALDGTTDIADLLAAVELPADQGWPAFLDRVEQILTDDG